MHNWENLTRQANKAYSNHAFLDAIELNRQALNQAEQSFEYDFSQDPESAIAAATVSFFNIAESYTALGDYISANTQYENAVNFLQSLTDRADLVDEQRDLIVRTAGHIRFEWDMFTQSYGKAFALQSKDLMKVVSHTVIRSKNVIHH
ncbi:tetratricopeptide repeat protein [Marinomonas sp. 2405UD68-3]|uniref:tetratricopeptide repeat protein n=1 Tax=Marinomonas sp. 2405UD68-3 TaxID=3391835 RepID=UPI0039C918F3